MSDIKEILSKYKSIAMVGVSNDTTKASTIVMKYMQKYGFKVYPVNPRAAGQKILGEEVFATISDIKDQVDIVDVVRPSKELMEKNDIKYIENKCTKIEYQKYFLKVRQAFPVLSD